MKNHPERARAVSAGTHPGERVHPEVVEVMREVGFDLSSEVRERVHAQVTNRGWSEIDLPCR